MGRLDSERTIQDLVALTLGDFPGQVDTLVDAYLVGTDARQFWQMRAELAHGFLNAAPFSELSYRIWRRIAGEGDDSEVILQFRSVEFLPPVEFQMTPHPPNNRPPSLINTCGEGLSSPDALKLSEDQTSLGL